MSQAPYTAPLTDEERARHVEEMRPVLHPPQELVDLLSQALDYHEKDTQTPWRASEYTVRERINVIRTAHTLRFSVSRIYKELAAVIRILRSDDIFIFASLDRVKNNFVMNPYISDPFPAQERVFTIDQLSRRPLPLDARRIYVCLPPELLEDGPDPWSLIIYDWAAQRKDVHKCTFIFLYDKWPQAKIAEFRARHLPVSRQ